MATKGSMSIIPTLNRARALASRLARFLVTGVAAAPLALALVALQSAHAPAQDANVNVKASAPLGDSRQDLDQVDAVDQDQLIEMEVVVMKSVPTFDSSTGEVRWESRPQTVRTYMRP